MGASLTVSTSQRSVRRGFTLIEAAIVTVIVGVGAVAMLQLLAAGTMSNLDSTNVTTAVNLATHIHERAMRMSYADLPSLDDQTYSPPIDARGVAIDGMTGWSQVVQVDNVDSDLLTLKIPDDQNEGFLRLTVEIHHHGELVHEASWIAVAPL